MFDVFFKKGGLGILLLTSPLAQAILDTNQNGASDLWERHHNNGDLYTTFAPTADPDGDGWTNVQEAAAGTHPADANHPTGFLRPEIIQSPAVYLNGAEEGDPPILLTPATTTIEWPTLTGKQYAVFSSTDLSPGSWYQVGEPRIGSDSILETHISPTQPDGSTPERLFLRVSISDVDSDDDDLTDHEEHQLGSDPHDPDSDDDGLDDHQEGEGGTDPKDADSDDDLLKDSEDAVPTDAVIDWQKTAEPKFAVIDLKIENPENIFFVDHSENGTVLFDIIPDYPPRRLVVDRNRNSHVLPGLPPDLGDPLGYFGAFPRTLIGDSVMGTRLRPPAPGESEDCTWDPISGIYTPLYVPWYDDSILDDRGQFRVENSYEIIEIEGELTFVDYLLTPYGILPGSEGLSGTGTIEKNGNIASMFGYWRFDSSTNTYSNNLLSETLAGAGSATLTQKIQNPPPDQGTTTHHWNLIPDSTGIQISKDLSNFQKSTVKPKIGQHLQGLTSQGWFATNREIWANGKWRPLKQTLSGTQPQDATLLGILDTGLGVAKIEYATEPAKIALLVPVEVTWKPIDGWTNVDAHIDPWSDPPKEKGSRIFPCYKDPDDTELRYKLQVVVKTSPALVGKTVYVKAFDVDDSTDEGFDLNAEGTAPVIDTNNKAGDDNLPDYLNTPLTGQFWNEASSSWGGQTATGVVDANGETKFHFRVGMQPGNNYRVVASVNDEAMYAGVQTTNPSADKYLGPEFYQNGEAPATPLLTVWRRLWVENDSMEAIPTDTYGYKRNDLSSDLTSPIIYSTNFDGTNTRFKITNVTDYSSFSNLENGRFIAQSVVHPVVGTLNIFGGHFVLISGDFTSVPINSGFRLYDDDDLGLSTSALPKQNLVNEQMKNYFSSSFIKVTNSDNFNSSRQMAFQRNIDVYDSSSITEHFARDVHDKNSIWACPLTVAYQGPQENDRDPNDASLRMGETAAHGNNDHSTVFLECCRETESNAITSMNPDISDRANKRLAKWIVAVAAHEMGHQPDNQSEIEDHQEGQLMSVGCGEVSSSSPEKAKFSAKTVKRFRKSNRWSQ